LFGLINKNEINIESKNQLDDKNNLSSCKEIDQFDGKPHFCISTDNNKPKRLTELYELIGITQSE